MLNITNYQKNAIQNYSETDKEVVVCIYIYIYTMEYYSAITRNEFESVLLRWMNLEPVIKNEASQKNKCHMLTYIYSLLQWTILCQNSPA